MKSKFERVIESPMVDGRIGLCEGTPFIKSINEPVSIVLGEILCCRNLKNIEDELIDMIGLEPDDLHAMLEFLSEVTINRKS